MVSFKITRSSQSPLQSFPKESQARPPLNFKGKYKVGSKNNIALENVTAVMIVRTSKLLNTL